jgi:hypothetical protein
MKMLRRGSSYVSITPIIERLIQMNPHTVLDIGAGDGKYGGLCREYLPDLEYVDALEPSGVATPSADWYRKIYVDTLETWVPEQKYELGLMTSVIQYLSPAALAKLTELRKKHLGRLLMTVPKHYTPNWSPFEVENKLKMDVLGEWDIPYEYIVLV